MKVLSTLLLLAFLHLVTLCNSAWSQAAGGSSPSGENPATSGEEHEAKEAANLDLEQLANVDIKVTSASKKSESLLHAPAAIYVLTAEDIRRGGFSSIPDALRTVPGLYVAQEDSHSWIVAARGFSYAFNDKMLVLLDGRLLYQPLFGGVYWDTIAPPMQDIERIEVIRGPAGTLWGANAMNGVINITTRSSAATQGASVDTAYGVNDGYKVSLRYGGEPRPGLSYRGWAQGFYGEPTVNSSGGPQLNDWYLGQAGMRIDWNISPKDSLTFEGEGYHGGIGTLELNFGSPGATGATEFDQSVQAYGGSILGRWKHTFSGRSALDVLAYCDWFDRIDILGGDIRNTCDLEIQHDYNFSPRHSLIWGGSILTTVDTPSQTFEISYSPVTQRDNVYSIFGQYEVSVFPDRLRLIGGVKVDHNPYSGYGVQPQLRGVWTPDKSSTLWAAFSRAVREPGRLNSTADLKIAETTGGPLPVFFDIVGNHSLSSELLRAYELGYRYQPSPGYSFDISAYYDHYTKLIVPGTPGAPIIFPDYIEIPVPVENADRGQTHGMELSLQARPFDRWQINAGLTELRGVSTVQGAQGVATPHHLMFFQSRFNLNRTLHFDSNYFYTDALPELKLPTLNRVDVGFSTRAFSGFTFSVWGRNLQSARHLESNSSEPYFPAGEIRRSVVLKLTWQSKSEPAGKPSH